MDAYERIMKYQSGELLPARTGYPYLDKALLGGFYPQHAIAIGARPGVGKSYLAQKIMNNGNNCDTLWIAVKNTVSPNDVIPDLADHAIEMIADNAFDNYGEFAEDYLMDVSVKQTDELDVEIKNVIINWMEKHSLQPTFYLVENAKIVHKNKDGENNA